MSALTQNVRNEYSMDFGLFQKLGQLNPMLNVVEVGRLVVWMSPQTGRLVTAACRSISSQYCFINSESSQSYTFQQMH